ncbi:MAG: NAD(P)H-binding protein, partial [Pseudomonadota bacterium]|nr:NAD(P)H-binding protein [Pseudomonadota bacterium]
LLAAEKAAGVKHHIALSIVGAERLPRSGYLRAKLAQERLIRESGIPFTIVHSTQFFEFLGGIAQSATIGDTVTVSSAYFQPIASDDVADVMADVALAEPINDVMEIGGPEPFRMNELVARFLQATNDPRQVVGDPHALYFGTELDDRSLVPAGGARIGSQSFAVWFARNPPRRSKAA